MKKRFTHIPTVMLLATLLMLGTTASASVVVNNGIMRSNELPALAAGVDAEHFTLNNGIKVTLYTPDVLTSRMSRMGNNDIIQLDGSRYITVVTDINHPNIYNRGDGRFHPFERDLVERSLAEIRHASMELDVTVYMLPFPRSNIMVSSTSGKEIFLSPHVLDIHPAVSAYIVTHEAGHVFHNCYLPDGSGDWSEFRDVRGIADVSVFHDRAAHAYRPKEIFAEDFRVLFGGTDAAFGGQIENPIIESPLAIPGLVTFFNRLGGVVVAGRAKLRASNYPNPFNPTTRISVRLPDGYQTGTDVTVRIYDVRGKLVRDLYAGAAQGHVELLWDGTDRVGNEVASANYYAVIRAGDLRQTLKLVMLK